MNAIKLGCGLALASVLLAPAAAMADPAWVSFREAKADFHDKEISLAYAFGPGSFDFALLDSLSLGFAVDRVFDSQSWYYRATWRVMDDPYNGVAIALNGGPTQIRERLAGDVIAPPVWGYQAGALVSLATDSGLTFRGAFDLIDTQWGSSDGPFFKFLPEIAYRWSLVELTIQPTWPLDFSNFNWVGIRIRI